MLGMRWMASALCMGMNHFHIYMKILEFHPNNFRHSKVTFVASSSYLCHLWLLLINPFILTLAGIVRRAVALGRYLQNPLAMVATLCGPRKEILSWKLSSLESFLNADEKFGMVEQIMVDVTNQVGLDVNLAISHEWLFAPLQYISGLGPRKAASLQRSLVRAGGIFTRKDFVTEHKLGKKVFVNAVGFLRIRRSGLAGSSSQFIDLLDDTRIHPESYFLAQNIATCEQIPGRGLTLGNQRSCLRGTSSLASRSCCSPLAAARTCYTPRE